MQKNPEVWNVMKQQHLNLLIWWLFPFWNRRSSWRMMPTKRPDTL